MITENYSSVMEWESFDFPLTIDKVTSGKKFYRIPENSRIIIKRDHQYKLVGRIEGHGHDHREFEYREEGRELKDGNIIKGDTLISDITPSGQIFQLYHCYITQVQFQQVVQGLSSTQFNAKLDFNSFTETLSEKPSVKKMRWYLTGKINHIFPRSTRRTNDGVNTKLRDGIDQVATKVVYNKQHGFSRDFFLIDSGGIKCIVQKVPEQFLPSWSHGISIEYREEFGIPEEGDQTAVAEIIGFITGTQLLEIGSTEYDKENYPIRRMSKDPWGNNIIYKCEKLALPPVDFPKQFNSDKIEKIINEVLPAYLSLRNCLQLSDVLWKYWIARDLAIGTNLPILSSALESLADKYLQHNNLLKSFSEKEKNDFTELVGDDVLSLEKKLAASPLKESVVGRLKNPFQTGIAEKQRLFFKAIGFDFGPKSLESKALKSRNVMTHSNIEVNEDTIPEYIKLTRAYETLFHRTLLKILGYTGKYLDYATHGHPERDLSQNIEDGMTK